MARIIDRPGDTRFFARESRSLTWAAARDASRTTLFAALVGAAIVIVAGVPLAANLNVWIDEAFTLHTTGHGPIAAWVQAIGFEGQPPLYFVAEALWRLGDEKSIAFARLPSILFAAAAVAVVVFAAKRVAPRVPAIVTALVTALNPMVVWAAVEMRVYALVLLVGAVLTWTFYESFLIDRPSRAARVSYVAFAIVGLYTQYYVGFVLAAHVLTLLVMRRAALRPAILSLAIVGIAFAPFVPVAFAQLGSSAAFVTHATLLHALHATANAAFVFVLPHDPNWTGGAKVAGFAGAFALLGGLVAFGRPIVREPGPRTHVVSSLVMLAVFGAVFSMCGLPSDPLRHLIVLAPASLLVALVAISSLTRGRRRAGIAALLMYALFAVTKLGAQYPAPLAKTGDWQRVAATLEAAGTAIPIAVFPAELTLPLATYLPVATIPIPKPVPFTIDYVRATTLTGEADVARVLAPASARSPRLWLVTNGVCRTVGLENYDYHCGTLENFLARRYRVERSIAFNGTLLRLYIRRAEPMPPEVDR